MSTVTAILFVAFGSYKVGAGITSQQFTTMDQCTAAAAQVRQITSEEWGSWVAFCVPVTSTSQE